MKGSDGKYVKERLVISNSAVSADRSGAGVKKLIAES